MKICNVNPGCGIPIPPPSWGAIETIVWELTVNLKKLGHEVDIKWTNEVKKEDYDLIIVHVANLALELAKKNIPYIFYFHDHHAFYYGKNSKAHKQNKKAIENSVITLVPARYLINYFDLQNICYFSHGINTEKFYSINKSKPIEPKLLMIGNNGLGGDSNFDRKGFTYGIALAQARNLPITIAGPSNNKYFFKNNINLLNYNKLNLIFDLSNEQLLNLYHQHDIFVHPTMLEAGHPNLTMLESVSSGLPIIANWEYETTFHGAWRSPRDVFEMSKGLDDIMNNWDLYREKCFQTSQGLSWYNRSKELIQIYERYFN
jgi:glycosyltransferase involved in cell wall biosynthesis